MIPAGVEVFVGLDPIDLRWGSSTARVYVCFTSDWTVGRFAGLRRPWTEEPAGQWTSGGWRHCSMALTSSRLTRPNVKSGPPRIDIVGP